MGEAVDIAFALAPMLALTRLSRPKAAAGWWFACGFAFWFATLAWMPAICKNNGPWPLVVLGWIGLAAACAGYMALFGWLDAKAWQFWGRNRVSRLAVLAVAEPVLWAGTEWLRGTLFTGFAWNFLGTAVGGIPSFATPARWGGVYFLSALVIMMNGVLATLLLRVIAPMRRRYEVDECDEEKDEEKTENRGKNSERLFRMAETAIPLLVVYFALTLSTPPSPLQTPQLTNSPTHQLSKIMIGFNRRFSPHAKMLKEYFEKRTLPLVMHYRVNAGSIPKDIWLQDPEVGGGRMVGEGCHFIDFMSYICGAPVEKVQAMCIKTANAAETPEDSVSVNLQFADGSVGTLEYVALGDTTLPKEWCEIHGEGSTAVMDNFCKTVCTGKLGKRKLKGKQQKGFKEELEATVAAVKGGKDMPITFGEIENVTRTTFAVLRALKSGVSEVV
jgi:hypothetical protein